MAKGATLLLAIGLLVSAGAGAQTVYKWVEDGVTHYGETPPAGTVPAEPVTLAPAPATIHTPDYRAILEQAERLEQARLARERQRARVQAERLEVARLEAQRAEAEAREAWWERHASRAPAIVLGRPFAPPFKPGHRLPHPRWKPGKHDVEHRATHDAPLHGQRRKSVHPAYRPHGKHRIPQTHSRKAGTSARIGVRVDLD